MRDSQDFKLVDVEEVGLLIENTRRKKRRSLSASARCDDAKLKAQQGAKPTKSNCQRRRKKKAVDSSMGLELAAY